MGTVINVALKGVAFSIALSCCAQASAALWPIGTEREVDEGTYMQVVAVRDGWRIWRVETRSGVNCKAVKSAQGRPHPEPVGVNSMMYNGTPFLELWSDGGARFYYHWTTANYEDIEIRSRAPGDKFWEERTNGNFDASEIGERVIEIAISSWEYPAIYEGQVEEKGLFDLTGLAWAQSEVRKCEGAESRP